MNFSAYLASSSESGGDSEEEEGGDGCEAIKDKKLRYKVWCVGDKTGGRGWELGRVEGGKGRGEGGVGRGGR